MNNSIQQKFNEWISKRFQGLSAHTLCQLIEMETKDISLPTDYINNMVYVDIFHVFTCQATESERNSYNAVSQIVNNCLWI